MVITETKQHYVPKQSTLFESKTFICLFVIKNMFQTIVLFFFTTDRNVALWRCFPLQSSVFPINIHENRQSRKTKGQA